MKRRLKMVRIRLTTLGVVLAISGCSGHTVDTVCNNPNLLWLWVLLPLVFGAVGGLAIYLGRIHQLKGWDLSSSPRAPTAKTLLIVIIVFIAILFVSFPIFMLPAEACEPDQKSDNITFWLMGSLLGTMTTLGGLWLANQHYSKGSE